MTACLLLSSCGGGGGAGVAQQTSSGFPAAVRDNFLNTCAASSGGKASACVCALNELEAAYSLAEFTELERRIETTGSLDPAIAEILRRCS
jgi:hypothetical protein